MTPKPLSCIMNRMRQVFGLRPVKRSLITAFLVFQVLIGFGIVSYAQTQGTQGKPTIPTEDRQRIIDEFFSENGFFKVLWTNYKIESFFLLLIIVGAFFVSRNHSRSSNRQEQRLLDTMQSNAIMIFDRSGFVRTMNRAAKQFLGLDDFVSMQEPYNYYLKTAPSPEIMETLEELMQTRHPIEREIVYNLAKTMKTLVLKGYPLYSEAKRLEGFVFLMADITEAIEKDRRVNWSGVAQHVAHKAKTPLSTITLSAQHLEMLLSEVSGKEMPDFSRYIDRIVNESRKLHEIVHNLTRLANKEQLNLLPNDVNILLLSIVDEYRAKVSRNIHIITHFTENLPRVGIDIAHFPEAIQNLLDNAIRAVGTNEGRIVVTTALGQWINRPGEYVEITIQDTGIGMSDEVKKSIFRPFSTHSSGGTGLGLVIVQKIVQEHNGEITFISTQNIGTTFQIRLPLPKY